MQLDFRPLLKLAGSAAIVLCVSGAVDEWRTMRGLGKRSATVHFQSEIANIILKNWHDPQQDVTTITEQQLGEFALKVAHYCPSRWNAIVSALRSVTARASILHYRKLRFRQFSPPTQLQFNALLFECDRLKKSHAGLIVRFLALTGLRIKEARALRWSNVFADRIEVPGTVSKNGKVRCVPLLAGAQDVLNRLKSLQNGSEYVLPPGNVRRGLEKACALAGLPRLSNHCFRHLFATRCIEAGVDLPTVARWLGHQDGGSLLAKMYFHLLDEHSREMAAKVRIGILSP